MPEIIFGFSEVICEDLTTIALKNELQNNLARLSHFQEMEVFLLQGALLRGRTATQRSEIRVLRRVLDRVLGKGSQKGSEKGGLFLWVFTEKKGF